MTAVARTAASARAPCVIECAGTPYAMGRAQGEATRASFPRLFEALAGSDVVPRPLRSAAALRRLLALSGWAVRRFDTEGRLRLLPHLVERLHGLADGADLPRDLLLGAALFEVATSKVAWLPIVQGACSALAVPAARSTTGGALLARNFDYLAFLGDFMLVRRSRPAGALASLELTVTGLVGCHTALNEAGLAASLNEGYTIEPVRGGVPLTAVVQHLAGSCRTVEEAIDVARSVPAASTGMITLADAAGEVAVVEVARTAVAVRRAPTEGEAALWTCNSFRAPETSSLELPPGSVVRSAFVPAHLRGIPVHASSLARAAHVARDVRARDRVSPDDLAALLRSHRPGAPRGDNDTVCRHGSNAPTLASAIVEPARGVMSVLLGSPCRGEYRELRV